VSNRHSGSGGEQQTFKNKIKEDFHITLHKVRLHVQCLKGKGCQNGKKGANR
jgi:hypothetical protein